MKFPSKEYKQKAIAAIKGCFHQDSQFLVAELTNLKPKMASVGIPMTLLDGEILVSITEKAN